MTKKMLEVIQVIKQARWAIMILLVALGLLGFQVIGPGARIQALEENYDTILADTEIMMRRMCIVETSDNLKLYGAILRCRQLGIEK